MKRHINRDTRHRPDWFFSVFILLLIFIYNVSAHAEPRPSGNIKMAIMPFLKGKKPENVDNLMTCGF